MTPIKKHLIPSNQSEIQKHINKRYQLIKKLGEGGTSIVYLAKDIGQTKGVKPYLVAVKVLNMNLNQNELEKWKYRFMKEADALRKLKSRNIVQIYNYDFNCKFPYIVIEYCDGETIRQRLNKIGPREELEALTVVEHILKTLAEIHVNSYVHRDLKPSNVIVNGYGEIKVLDFGIVYEHNRDFELTNENSIVGSAPYLAPELLTGQKKINFLCDFYSVGLILYELLTAKPAFQANSHGKLIEEITQKGCPNINKFTQKTFHPLTASIIQKSTSINPDDRYRSLSLFQRDIHYAKFKIVEEMKNDDPTKKYLISTASAPKSVNNQHTREQQFKQTNPETTDIDASLGTAFTSIIDLFNFLCNIVVYVSNWLLHGRHSKSPDARYKKISKNVVRVRLKRWYRRPKAKFRWRSSSSSDHTFG